MNGVLIKRERLQTDTHIEEPHVKRKAGTGAMVAHAKKRQQLGERQGTGPPTQPQREPTLPIPDF